MKIYKLRTNDHNFFLNEHSINIFYWNKQGILLWKLMNSENCYENYWTMKIVLKTIEQWKLLWKLMNNEYCYEN